MQTQLHFPTWVLQCFELAQHSAQRFSDLGEGAFDASPSPTVSPTVSPTIYSRYQLDYRAVRFSNWPHDVIIGEKDLGEAWLQLQFLPVFLWISGIIYGGIHLLVWGGPLNSKAELDLWRIAAVLIVSTPVAQLLLAAYVGFVSSRRTSKDKSSRPTTYYSEAAAILSFFLVCYFYVLARLYLVVESFISLPYVVDGVYLKPQWSRYFPHIPSLVNG